MGELFIGLVNNSILLFSIGLFYILLPLKKNKLTLFYKIVIGLLTGFVGLIIMSTPFQITDGIVLDTRSVLLSVSGFFFGLIPTLIAAIFTSIHRIVQGGTGMYTGVLVIIITSTLGIIAGRLKLLYLDKNKMQRVAYMYVFSVIVHMVMLLSFLTLGSTGLELVKNTAASIMIIYPITSVLLSMVLFKQRDMDHMNVELEHLSTHDYLTGLYNRSFMESEFKKLDTKENYPISIIIGDVNGLKLVNDSFGHKSGDDLLIRISSILKEAFPNNSVARWGGDEFVIILPKTNENKVDKLCSRTMNIFKEASNSVIPPSISLGHSTKNRQIQNIEETLNEAEEMMYRVKLQEGKSVRNSMINTLETTLYEKSLETEQHATHMSKWGALLAEAMGCDTSTINEISLLSRLHDIGKIGISDRILLKDKKLNASEWVEIKKHPEIGYRILNSVHELSHIAEDVLHHHERWDGKGYPKGLSKEDIPLNSRIISIVDAFEVMINGRPYKKAMTMKEALEEIKRCAGSQFDPNISKEFCKIVENKFI